MKIVNFSEFEKTWTTLLPKFNFLPPVYSESKRFYQRSYCDKICAFDIETTTIKSIKQSVMYVWQFAVETELVIIGRTWAEFKKLVSILNTVAKYNRIVVFVHNLSFEFVFLSGIFQINNEDVFILDSRKILKCDIGQLEFRCSYRLSNLSLKDFTARYKVKHQKIDGDLFDYSKERFPWTPLTDLEKEYITNDVLGLIEAVHALMDLYSDTIYTLPLTSTGLVRRICRDRINEKLPVYDKYGNLEIDKKGKEIKVAIYKKQVLKCYPSYDVFKMLRQEFRGGNTHANRYYATEIMENVTSFDISSSYPSAQCNRLYPAEPFEEIKNISLKKIEKLIEREKPVLFEVTLYNVKLRYRYFPIPYIPVAKCRRIKDARTDNGRILSAGELTITINDIDWKIISAEYEFSAVVSHGYKSGYGILPKPIIDCNVEFFKQKTELKGIPEQKLYYDKNKELLNSIYGMTVQNPAKPELLFSVIENGEEIFYTTNTSKSEEILLEESRKRAFLCYQYGCWTTSHARSALEVGINICGDDLLYVDTDSCKFIGKHDFSSYNAEQKQLSEKSGLFAADMAGTYHYGGVYEHDDFYPEFVTYGAKKYAYTDENGKCHVTVSGVGKKKGAEQLEKDGGLSAFKEGYIFHNCGKTASHYNDGYYGKILIDGHELEITRNVVIEEKDYTLSLAGEYSLLLNCVKADILKTMEIIKNTNGEKNF